MSTSSEYKCWSCGAQLQGLILPMSRREECAVCNKDQHVCKMCEHFTPSGCNEERAEHVSDAERANFCDYFSPSKSAYSGGNTSKADAAKAQLAALFGDEVADDSASEQELSPAELAEKKLRDMLNQ